MTTFASRLRAAMIHACVSSTELAAKVGVSKASISQYLSGKIRPSGSTTARLAGVLGITTEHLMTDPPTPAPSMERITTQTAARCLGKSEYFVRNGLQQGLLPFGTAVPGTGSKYIYFINPDMLREFAGAARFDRFFGGGDGSDGYHAPPQQKRPRPR